MAKLNKIVAFVATRDAEKAKLFYQNTLGLKFVSDDGFALVFDIQGTMLRIARVEKLSPAPYTVLGWQVEKIEQAVSGLSEKGVRFERFPGMPQDQLGIWSASGGAKVAWFKDPDGNMLSLSPALMSERFRWLDRFFCGAATFGGVSLAQAGAPVPHVAGWLDLCSAES
jgi:catechol 2,3-dioxygenase-like lactoylglutathione lyase family enzyme